MKSVINVKNLTKKFALPKEKKNTFQSYFLNPFHRVEYDKFMALKKLNFEVEKGEFVGIIGSNGSGKTTLLRILAGIYEPTEGEVSLRGRLVPFLELGVGFNEELPARDSIYLNGVLLGMSKKEVEKRFDDIVDFAEIRDFVDTPLKNYSSGMQVRLAFSIAIQMKADVYLLDEVLAVGDANFQKKCFNTVEQFKKDGKTILFVSHEMDDIRRFCDRVLVLDKGKMIFDGKTDEAIEVYKDVYKNKGKESEFKSN